MQHAGSGQKDGGMTGRAPDWAAVAPRSPSQQPVWSNQCSRKGLFTTVGMMLFFFWLEKYKEEEEYNHPAVCKTRQHQLKTTPLCVTLILYARLESQCMHKLLVKTKTLRALGRRGRWCGCLLASSHGKGQRGLMESRLFRGRWGFYWVGKGWD